MKLNPHGDLAPTGGLNPRLPCHQSTGASRAVGMSGDSPLECQPQQPRISMIPSDNAHITNPPGIGTFRSGQREVPSLSTGSRFSSPTPPLEA